MFDRPGLLEMVKALVHRMTGNGVVVDQAVEAGQAAGLNLPTILEQLLTLIWTNAGPQIVAAIEAWIQSLIPKPPATA